VIIWLASYPKSGNTWIRAMLSSLLYTEDGCFNITHLKKIHQYPTREVFKDFVKDHKNIKEIMKYWITTQDIINLDKKIKLFKTHNALCRIENYPFTNNENTLATIYIVRDPRNVITSIANHYNYNYEEAKNFMFNSSQAIISNKKDDTYSIGTILGSWSDHYNTWTKNNKNLLIIKYENLILNAKGEIKKIINFIKKYIKIDTNEIKINNCVKTSTFENLKKIEESGFFDENMKKKTTQEKIKFFYLGKENKWEDLLDNKIRLEIEQKFFKEMKELKYI